MVHLHRRLTTELLSSFASIFEFSLRVRQRLFTELQGFAVVRVTVREYEFKEQPTHFLTLGCRES